MEVDQPEGTTTAPTLPPIAGANTEEPTSAALAAMDDSLDDSTRANKKRKRANQAHSAFSYYRIIQKPSLKKAWPNTPNRAINAKLKETWSSLSPEEKQVHY